MILKNELLCGKTNHFTNFCLLLDSTANSIGSGNDEIFIWLSVSFVGASIVFIFVAVLIIEIRYRIRQRNVDLKFKVISRRIASASKE